MSNFEKLSDDMLDKISGGTNGEMIDLQTRLNATNIKGIIQGLKAHGISAELSSTEDNIYTDINTGKNLSHDEVLSLLKKQ